MPDPRDVFVVHGRDDQARKALWAFLQALDLRPLDWEEVRARTGKPTPYMLEVLEKGFATCQAAVVPMTPDDGASLHPALQGSNEPSYETVPTGQPRPNMLIEAGMALALQPERTVVIEIGRLRPASDLGGLNVVHLNDRVESLNKIAGRLRSAGCAVDTTGTDWLDVTRFQNLTAYGRRF